MIQLKLISNFLGGYWKEIAVGILIGFAVFVVTSWWTGTAEISRLKTQLNFAAVQNEALQDKVTAFESAEQAAKDNQAKSLKDREIIVTTLTKEINKIRTQVIPKDCNGAVAYGIQFKDDMKWPERSSQ
jgi:outer membrane murein-binding lipoprotein Lpp